MAGRVEGKVAFITGAARGQGRSHAIGLAREGADIIATDICGRVNSVPYPLASEEDLRQTVEQVEATGRRIVAVKADVRDLRALASAAAEGVARLGRLDIVSANAGIFATGRALDLSANEWQDMIDVNLTGVWHTVKATVPHIVAGSRGGSVILTSSMNGAVGAPMFAHYIAAKHGVVGLVRALAIELGPDRIRVNGLMPAGVATQMVRGFTGLMTLATRYVPPDPALLGKDHPMKDVMLAPEDVTAALLFLASDESRHMTGSLVQVDGKWLKQAASGPG